MSSPTSPNLGSAESRHGPVLLEHELRPPAVGVDVSAVLELVQVAGEQTLERVTHDQEPGRPGHVLGDTMLGGIFVTRRGL